ncbi:TPA: DotI/IcmL family type IV secretion protein [Legionella pneumophila]|uniref:DotI/IcmL family type IV secretion protein n=1 Tax=Legionella pneumophila TaxID=446 RepID=UPI000786CA3E|nr:DotI/IcmL family type IV secretion protein [Legionella pneumophila]MDW8879800.1 DotI/IcmL family type IV secretion protein [Legionella pneumophila subsp. fraseri]MDW8962710.1 DotI/IcmL family type IV secretion protein [Legionella pneumophila subsp. fraseri]MDW9035810.1 DotI/IcmL family type IV secretion protein [Legionella pneumophila subsp. fraseri]MDW9039311.1 DotI/IcmL family type IV secretion protein [Legionella pneumophila subsp. fraseri]MDW9042159.1 DotI/IcmL family type IV secretion 
MDKKITIALGLLISITAKLTYAQPDRAQLAVWANEAIIATYTFDYKNYMQQQKEIAKYFSADGWIAYSKALNQSKLPEVVQKNAYYVNAVATEPPKLITLDPTHWQAIMPILVVYKNPQYKQKQNLKVILGFTVASPGQGVRGFSVTSLQSTPISPPCQCKNEETSGNAKQGDAKQ